MLFMHWWHIVWLMLTCQMTAAAIATSTPHLAGVDGSEDKLLATDQPSSPILATSLLLAGVVLVATYMYFVGLEGVSERRPCRHAD